MHPPTLSFLACHAPLQKCLFYRKFILNFISILSFQINKMFAKLKKSFRESRFMTKNNLRFLNYKNSLLVATVFILFLNFLNFKFSYFILLRTRDHDKHSPPSQMPRNLKSSNKNAIWIKYLAKTRWMLQWSQHYQISSFSLFGFWDLVLLVSLCLMLTSWCCR